VNSPHHVRSMETRRRSLLLVQPTHSVSCRLQVRAALQCASASLGLHKWAPSWDPIVTREESPLGKTCNPRAVVACDVHPATRPLGSRRRYAVKTPNFTGFWTIICDVKRREASGASFGG
jgi:hypothetical protein